MIDNIIEFEEKITKEVLTTYKEELSGKPNFKFIESFINEEVILEIVRDVLHQNRRNSNFENLISAVLLKLEYLGLPYKWENYYVNKE